MLDLKVVKDKQLSLEQLGVTQSVQLNELLNLPTTVLLDFPELGTPESKTWDSITLTNAIALNNPSLLMKRKAINHIPVSFFGFYQN